jgi:hypothetical protein
MPYGSDSAHADAVVTAKRLPSVNHFDVGERLGTWLGLGVAVGCALGVLVGVLVGLRVILAEEPTYI